MSSTETKLMTADELLRMPDDGFRYELVKGELRRRPFGGLEHGRIAMNLAAPLHEYVKSRKLGLVYATGTGFVLANDPDTVRAPDIGFVRNERVLNPRVESYINGAPDLAVEVLEPDDTANETDARVAEWFESGARAVWVVDPRTTSVIVYRPFTDVCSLVTDETLSGGEVVPGFEIAISEIFAL